MAEVVVDTDVVSFLFKNDSRADLYRDHLDGKIQIVSFMTIRASEYELDFVLLVPSQRDDPLPGFAMLDLRHACKFLVFVVLPFHAIGTLGVFAERSPFTKVECTERSARVVYDGEAYDLVSIDGVAIRKILRFCREKYRSKWEKRFAEDLVEVMSGVGRPSGKMVKLVLRDPASGKARAIPEAPMTTANRRAVWSARKLRGTRPTAPARRTDPAAVVESFANALDTRWSYRRAKSPKIDDAVAKLRARVETEISNEELAIELQRIVALGIDGHARVSGVRLPPGFLPFLIEPVGERFVAFRDDRSSFVDPSYPVVTRIDGDSVESWCERASVLVARGSPQFVKRHALRELRHISYWRAAAGRDGNSPFEVELASADGAERKTISMRPASRRPIYGVWPRQRSRNLSGNIGYLRLATMSERGAVRDLLRALARVREANGLIVDVRDNGGGSRVALRVLFSYLLRDGDTPRVVNCAAYRSHSDFGAEHLAARFMYRADSPAFGTAEKRAIAAFRRRFKPRWRLPKAEFSDWHYLVLGELDDPNVYHFDKPVVILMNAKCFSATDVFLAGLKGWRDVTLVGTPSGGGSARVTSVNLSGGDFSVRLGSMASFQADGNLFDGHGVQPDVVVEPSFDYFIGGSDPQLERARSIITQ